jgi:hypothetical protein
MTILQRLPKEKVSFGTAIHKIFDLIIENYRIAKNYILSSILCMIEKMKSQDNYFTINFNNNDLSIVHYKNGKIFHYFEKVNINDDNWLKYCTNFAKLPIYLILNECDVEFRTVDLRKVKFWDRSVLIHQVKKGEFNNNFWVFGKSKSDSSFFKEKYLISAIKLDDGLNNVIRKIRNLRNPFAGLRLLNLELSVDNINKTDTKIENTWYVVLVNFEDNFSDKVKIIIFFNKIPVLQREVKYQSSEEIENSINTTMRFLERFGYEDHHRVKIMATSTVGKFSNKISDNFELVNFDLSQEIFDSYNPKKYYIHFVPKELKTNYMFFRLPDFFAKYIFPASLFVFIICCYNFTRGYFLNYDYNLTKSRLEKYQKKLPQNYNVQIKKAEIFGYFQDAKQKNPIKPLLALGYAGKNHNLSITQIDWKHDEKDYLLKIKFYKKIPQNSKNKFERSLEENFKNICPDYNWVWHNQDYELVLQMRCHYK